MRADPSLDAHTLVPRRLRAIVFDWDGTLADSTAIIAASLQRACADLSIPVPDDRAARHVIGLGLADALNHVAPSLAVERYPELADRYRVHFLSRDPEIPLFPGVRELLQELQDAGYRMGIATGKSRVGLDAALAHQDIARFFATTRCADEGRPKPHPDMLHFVMGALGAGAGESVMIGESHDVQMARSAGVAAVAVSYGAHAADELMKLHGVPLMHSIAQLRQWLAVNG